MLNEENFCGMLKPIIGWYGHTHISWRNFHGWLQITKFVNVFSLESFVLYGMTDKMLDLSHTWPSYIYQVSVLSQNEDWLIS